MDEFSEKLRKGNTGGAFPSTGISDLGKIVLKTTKIGHKFWSQIWYFMVIFVHIWANFVIFEH